MQPTQDVKAPVYLTLSLCHTVLVDGTTTASILAGLYAQTATPITIAFACPHEIYKQILKQLS